jgi:hypothetical protein
MRKMQLIEAIKRHSQGDLRYTDTATALANEICEGMVSRDVYVEALDRIAELEKEVKAVRTLLAAKLDRPLLRGVMR